jgi:hypothetical protein
MPSEIHVSQRVIIFIVRTYFCDCIIVLMQRAKLSAGGIKQVLLQWRGGSALFTQKSGIRPNSELVHTSTYFRILFS